jgi:hypothetical protein
MTSINEFKMDNRTKEEFIADMEKGLSNEVRAIKELRLILKNSKVEKPSVIYVGSEKEGEIEFDDNNEVADVDTFPDYLLKYKKQGRIRARFLEVKTCNPHSHNMFFKVSQIHQYCEIPDVLILFIMGASTKFPMYTLVKPQDIVDLKLQPQLVYGKKTYIVPKDNFHWEVFSHEIARDFNIIEKDYLIKK